MINIIEVTGYDDGFYWDYRVYFEYDGNPYTYLCWGSGSGVTANYMGIRKGGERLPEGERWTSYVDEPKVDEERLLKAVKLLLESGGDEFEIEEDDAEKYGWEWW